MSEEQQESSIIKRSFWAVIEEFTLFRVIGILMLCYPVVYLVSYWIVGVAGGNFAYLYSGPPVSVWRTLLLSFWLTAGAYLVVLGHFQEICNGRRRY